MTGVDEEIFDEGKDTGAVSVSGRVNISGTATTGDGSVTGTVCTTGLSTIGSGAE